MKKALYEAEKALCNGEFPVGSIFVYENNIISTGSREGTTGRNSNNEIDHAEMIGLRRIPDIDMDMRKKITVFSTLEPCLMCFGALLINGIGKIVYAYEDVMGGATNINLAKLSPLYQNCTLSIIKNIMRNESYKLFQTYFKNSKNDYLKGSVLAEYTLNL